ncbi:MAG: hypothetical protein KDA33_08405 [Phycisphaerales bacterium]|nr:hypothetical protein [Phycisphaerales bacterium]
MTIEPDNPQDPKIEFELEALPEVKVDPNDGFTAVYYPGVSQRGDHNLPVPDQDGYLCPHCGYDVRRLAGRICPECGQHFEVAEARRAGKARDPHRQADARAISGGRVASVTAGLFWTFGFVGPLIARGKAPTPRDLATQVVLLAPFVVGALMYSYCVVRPGREAFIVVACFYAIFSLVLILA